MIPPNLSCLLLKLNILFIIIISFSNIKYKKKLIKSLKYCKVSIGKKELN
jgi:hypothetical protein